MSPMNYFVIYPGDGFKHVRAIKGSQCEVKMSLLIGWTLRQSVICTGWWQIVNWAIVLHQKMGIGTDDGIGTDGICTDDGIDVST